MTNWNNVFSDTQRIPCQPYAWFPDPENIGQFRQVPIPSSVYNKCLEYQDKYILTPNKNSSSSNPVCPLSIVAIPGATGFDPSNPSLNISALDYCLCNCKNFGGSDTACQNICSSDPDLKNYTDATSVWTNGWTYDSDSKSCKLGSGNGEFLSKEGCEKIIKASPIPSGGGGGSSGGSGGGDTPNANTKYYVYGLIGLIILLLLIGIVVDIRRIF